VIPDRRNLHPAHFAIYRRGVEARRPALKIRAGRVRREAGPIDEERRHLLDRPGLARFAWPTSPCSVPTPVLRGPAVAVRAAEASSPGQVRRFGSQMSCHIAQERTDNRAQSEATEWRTGRSPGAAADGCDLAPGAPEM